MNSLLNSATDKAAATRKELIEIDISLLDQISGGACKVTLEIKEDGTHEATLDEDK